MTPAEATLFVATKTCAELEVLIAEASAGSSLKSAAQNRLQQLENEAAACRVGEEYISLPDGFGARQLLQAAAFIKTRAAEDIADALAKAKARKAKDALPSGDVTR